MTEDTNRKNPCGDDKEIDEYLNGTICEVVPPEEDLNDIEPPEDDEFEVDEMPEPEKLKDEYLGNS